MMRGRQLLTLTSLGRVCLALLFLLISGRGLAEPQQEAPAAAEESPATAAALGVVERLTPEYSGRVSFVLTPALSAPTISPQGKEGICISANCVRECLRAYGWYLRHIARVHLSRNGDNKSAARWEQPRHPLQVPPTLPLNFAYNYCTLSYTGAHWDTERWMRELDLLALEGFHYVLITPGLEKVWQNFLRELGHPEPKISAFIANPAYSAWWHMGNLEGEGGPVSQELIDSEARLGQQLVRRARELGLEPVLQGYVGFLPHDFEGHRSALLPQGKWCGIYTRPSVLRPDTAAFPEVASLWYKHLQAVYDYTPRAFAGDLFHEGGNHQGVSLDKAAAAVQKAMQRFSPGSLWFIQAWGHNPLPQLLQGTSERHTVILALHKNLSPAAQVQRTYGGRRYVWCELANFGGKQGLYGGLDLLETMEGDAGGASGLGLLSEGLETNPLYYELFFERLSHRGRISRADFLTRYAHARYGSRDARLVQALHALARSVYTPDTQREGGLENLMCARPGPGIDRASTWSNPTPYYDPQDVLQAGRLMLAAAQDDPQLLRRSTFRYDLVDVCREALANKARAQLQRCRAAAQAADTALHAREAQRFCALIEQMSDLLAAHEDYLLGAYLRGVAARGGAAMQRSVRQLITTWSPTTGILNDYSHRQFSELMRHYYLPRWQLYFRLATPGTQAPLRSQANTNNGTRVTTTWYECPELDSLEASFRTAEIPLLTEPQGDLLRLAEQALQE